MMHWSLRNASHMSAPLAQPMSCVATMWREKSCKLGPQRRSGKRSFAFGRTRRALLCQAASYSSASMMSFYKCTTDPTGPYSRPATPDTVTEEYASLERRHARATEPRTVESYMSSDMVSFYQ